MDAIGERPWPLPQWVGVDPAGLARATTALGNVLENRGNYDQAIIHFNESLRLDPSTASILSVTVQP